MQKVSEGVVNYINDSDFFIEAECFVMSWENSTIGYKPVGY